MNTLPLSEITKITRRSSAEYVALLYRLHSLTFSATASKGGGKTQDSNDYPGLER